MPGPIRKPLAHPAHDVQLITPRIVDLFEYLMKLPRPVKWTPESSNVELEFEQALGGAGVTSPHPVFDCDHDNPPAWMDDPEHIAAHYRSRAIRVALEEALAERRRARHSARQPAPSPSPPPATP